MTYELGYSWCRKFYSQPILSMKCSNPDIPGGCDGTFHSSEDFYGRVQTKETTMIFNECSTCGYRIMEFEHSVHNTDIYSDDNICTVKVIGYRMRAADQQEDLPENNIVLQ